jgi:hypothetical protein
MIDLNFNMNLNGSFSLKREILTLPEALIATSFRVVQFSLILLFCYEKYFKKDNFPCLPAVNYLQGICSCQRISYSDKNFTG